MKTPSMRVPLIHPIQIEGREPITELTPKKPSLREIALLSEMAPKAQDKTLPPIESMTAAAHLIAGCTDNGLSADDILDRMDADDLPGAVDGISDFFTQQSEPTGSKA